MLFEFMTAGFGGQGILYLGDVLAGAALREGRNATFLPTYGAAMRGGTANCVVIISDKAIGAMTLDQPHAAVLMNQPSFEKFQAVLRPGGLIVANTSLVDPSSLRRTDLRVVWIPATQISKDVVGTERSANIVALGALLKAEPIVETATIEAIFRDGATGKRRAMLDKNLAALRAGLDFQD
ncbi:MAG TPA: 2-oxoacid:acceptor oxidoreductase family protein [Candidatus Hydrogenedentes bacterium]|nr:2-oxoacid:acceptor oxidoreductase family protein [Candidatus Hydrogenedentota bacterium]